jgi:hypothetical protein
MSQEGARGVEVTLTQQEIEQVEALARERDRSIGACVDRFASPEERCKVGRRLDPSTAEVFFIYAQVVDPYGDCDDLPAEAHCVGREWFAVDPVERIAVHAEDIPDEIWILLEPKRREANAEGWREVFAAVRRTS